MIAIAVTFGATSVFLFLLFVGTYQKAAKLEKRLEKIERESTLVRDVVLSHNDTIGKYMEVTDYLLVKDGGAGVYMGERGDA